jgi:hypothetical protein
MLKDNISRGCNSFKLQNTIQLFAISIEGYCECSGGGGGGGGRGRGERSFTFFLSILPCCFESNLGSAKWLLLPTTYPIKHYITKTVIRKEFQTESVMRAQIKKI